jgi:hypothetical protein
VGFVDNDYWIFSVHVLCHVDSKSEYVKKDEGQLGCECFYLAFVKNIGRPAKKAISIIRFKMTVQWAISYINGFTVLGIVRKI